MAKIISQPMLPGMPRNRDLLTDEVRYKRGYTPGRYKEMASALEPVDVRNLGSSWGRQGSNEKARDEVTRMAANSSLTPDNLSGIHSIKLYPNNNGILGEYFPGEKPNISLYNHIYTGRNSRADTFLHEVGHHNDSFINSSRRTDEEQGKREAFADSFANKNRGKQFKGQGYAGSTYLANIREYHREEEMSDMVDTAPRWKPTTSVDFNHSYITHLDPNVHPAGKKETKNKKKKYKGEKLPLESGHYELHRSLSD